MRARLTAPYTGPAGRFDAGRVVTDQQIPREQLQAMVSAGHAEAVGVVEVETTRQPVPETADLKPKHVGGGWYDRGDGGANVRKSDLTDAELELLE